MDMASFYFEQKVERSSLFLLIQGYDRRFETECDFL